MDPQVTATVSLPALRNRVTYERQCLWLWCWGFVKLNDMGSSVDVFTLISRIIAYNTVSIACIYSTFKPASHSCHSSTKSVLHIFPRCTWCTSSLQSVVQFTSIIDKFSLCRMQAARKQGRLNTGYRTKSTNLIFGDSVWNIE